MFFAELFWQDNALKLMVEATQLYDSANPHIFQTMYDGGPLNKEKVQAYGVFIPEVQKGWYPPHLVRSMHRAQSVPP